MWSMRSCCLHTFSLNVTVTGIRLVFTSLASDLHRWLHLQFRLSSKVRSVWNLPSQEFDSRFISSQAVLNLCDVPLKPSRGFSLTSPSHVTLHFGHRLGHRLAKLWVFTQKCLSLRQTGWTRVLSTGVVSLHGESCQRCTTWTNSQS